MYRQRSRGPNLTGNKVYRTPIAPSLYEVGKIFGKEAKDLLADRTAALNECAPKVLDGINRIIGSKGSSLGQPWPGLKNKYYLTRKERKGWNRAEMYASGEMIRGIRRVGVKNPKKLLKVGVDAAQARALQRGVGRTKGKGFWVGSPRVFIALDDQAIRDVREILEADVSAKLTRLAGKINASRDSE